MLPEITTIESKICYYCETCKGFMLPDHHHTGQEKRCLMRSTEPYSKEDYDLKYTIKDLAMLT